MRVLLTCIPSYGHFAQIRAASLVLSKHGHEICVACTSKFASELITLGLRHEPSGLFDYPEPKSRKGLFDIRWMIREAMPTLTVRMYQDLSDIFDKFRPELVIRDFAERAAFFMSQQQGLRHVSIAAEPMAGLLSSVDLGGWVQRVRAALGLPHDPDENEHSPFLHLFPCPPEFHPSDAALLPTSRYIRHENLVAGVNDVKHILGLVDRSKPLVLVALGTLVARQNADLMAQMIANFRGESLSIIFMQGCETSQTTLIDKDRVLASAAPQQALIPHADVVVCHGGWQTVLETLSEGIPLVIAPAGGDLFYTASRCSSLGVAATVDFASEPESMTAAVWRVLEDPSYHIAAEYYQRRNSEMPTLMSALLQTGLVHSA